MRKASVIVQLKFHNLTCKDQDSVLGRRMFYCLNRMFCVSSGYLKILFNDG